MCSPETDVTKDPGRLIHLAAVVRSAAGECLDTVMAATGYDIDLEAAAFRHAGQGHEISAEMFDARLTVDLPAAQVDLRESVPAQVSAQLLTWARHLTELAGKVDQVPDLRPILTAPRAHIVVNVETGEAIDEGPFYETALDDLVELHKANGRPHRIITGPLGEWPDAEWIFNQLVLHQIEQARANRKPDAVG